MTRDEAMTRMARADSQDRAAVLLSVADDLSDADLKYVMQEWWTSTEAWGGTEMRHEILLLLHRVGYITDTRRKPKLDRSLPGMGVVCVYRGNIGEDPTEGFCWTTSEKTAEFFGRAAFSPRGAFLGLGRDRPWGEMKPGAVAMVWKGYVYRQDILGYFVGRSEEEVIIDPADLLMYDWHSKAVTQEEKDAHDAEEAEAS